MDSLHPVSRTALVTGSGRNIGRSIAVTIGELGHNVVVNGSADRAACEAVAAEVEQAGGRAVVAMGDVSRRESFDHLIKVAHDAFGSVDILINNAAIRPEKPFLDTTDADWHRVLDVDLNAVFYGCRAALPGMVSNNWGRIINLTGMNAIHGYSGRAPVSVAKHGVWGLTKALAKEFGSSGITVNAISPGPILGARDSQAKADQVAGDIKYIPIGRLGAPEEVAVVASMLASDRGAFVNGQMIQVNGGAAM